MPALLEHGRADTPPAWHRLLLPGVLLAFAGFWLWLAVSVHTMFVIGGEIDGYLGRAGELLDGHLVSDRLHPFGLPVAIAGLGLFGVDLFVAGKLIGVASGLWLLASTFWLARTWVGPITATLLTIAVGASENVLTGAVQACSDVPAAALLCACVLAWTRAAASEHPRARSLVAGGIALGLAVFVRTPSMAYAPAFLPLLLGVRMGELLLRAGWGLLGGAIGIAPHVVTTWLSPQTLGQNASQIVWKFRFAHDDDGWYRYLAGSDPKPVRWSEFVGWMWSGLGDLWRYVSTEIASPWVPGASAVPTAIVSVFLTATLLLPCLLRRRAAAVAALAGTSFCGALCVLSFPIYRLTVPIVAPLLVLGSLGWWPRGPRSRAVPPVLSALFAIGALANVPGALVRFEGLHARAEMQVARELIAERGEWISIALPTVACETGLPCVFCCWLASAPAPGAPREQWGRLLASPTARTASFVLVAHSSYPAVHAEMTRVPPPAGYRRIRDGDVLVFEKVGADAWLASADVAIDATGVHLSLRLSPSTDIASAAAIGFLARRLPDGEWGTWNLPRGGDGSHALTLPTDALHAGERWQFVPGLLTWQGEWWRAAPIERVVPVGVGR